MKVVIDSNIFRQDFLMQSRKFEMFVDYILKTDTKILMPKVVYQEIGELYQRELTSLQNQINTSRLKLLRLLFDSNIPEISINPELEKEKYLGHIKQKLKINNADLIPYKNEYLPNLVNRAIKGRRPLSSHKQEFRDGLIWLTLLEVSKDLKENAVVFISANTKDFADCDKNLHPDLIKEAEANGVTISFYSSLDDFIKAHAEKVAFITKDWILSNYDLEMFNKKLQEDVIGWGSSKLESWFEDKDPKFSEILSIKPVSIDLFDFYVYEMSDASIRIESTFESEFEIEYRTEKENANFLEMEWGYHPVDGEFDWRPVTKSRTVSPSEVKHKYAIIYSEFHTILKDQDIQNIELITWHI